MAYATDPVIPCLLVTDILINTRYTITETHLMIRSGVLVRQKIEIESIREIENTSTILSSPALSFDRIVIRYGIYDETVISPKDKTVFCKLLKDRNHSIVVNI
ncbi:MAG: PH domain-containing protein [Prevotella sp.]|nr:PH domain-containing protein [Prevotella sp.]